MDDDVLGFYISVNDTIGVQLLDSRADLLHDVCSLEFGHGLTPLQLLVELSSRRKLKNQVDMVLVIEESEHLDDVGVVQELLDLDFPCELVDNFLLS